MTKHIKKSVLEKSILAAALFFLIGCSAGTLFFSGLANDLTSHSRNTSRGSAEAASTSPEKLYVRNKDKQTLSSIALLTSAPGLLRDGDGNRMNFQLIPGLGVGTSTPSSEKVVYLTFDDGPSVNTQAVLDVLDKYNAKATFFVTGINTQYAALIKTAADKGHTIGLHTMCHDYATIYASEDAYFKDLERIGNLVSDQIGYIPCFVRFPGGSSNTISARFSYGIMTKLSTDVITKGYQYYDWNADCEDGSGTLTPDQLYSRAIKYSSNNIVLLCHDASGKETTVQALPEIIEHFQSEGYVFRGIDRESYAPHHSINN
ncbi:MAG: polysaccharide deacetylase [Hespellia sp.]|nr:polysaccharide deacetylase [Hespellia sp.]